MNILNTMYYDPPPNTKQKQNKQKKNKNIKRKSFYCCTLSSENEPLFSSVLMHTSFLFCTITLFPVIKSSVATVLLSCMVSTGQPSPYKEPKQKSKNKKKVVGHHNAQINPSHPLPLPALLPCSLALSLPYSTLSCHCCI